REHAEVWTQLSTACKHVVDHVCRRDFSEQSWNEVVVDPLRCESVTREAADATAHSVDPSTLVLSCSADLRPSLLYGRGGFRAGCHHESVAMSEESLDQR